MTQTTASFSTTAFFSNFQLRAIEHAMVRLEGVGINITSFRQLERTRSNGDRVKTDEQYRSFVGLAKLWHVVKKIIALAFIDKLVEGKLVLEDNDGNTYKLTLVHSPSKENLWFPPMEDDEDDPDRQQDGER
jgi:hypothetical protein